MKKVTDYNAHMGEPRDESLWISDPSLPLLGKIAVEIVKTRIPIEDQSAIDEIKFRIDDTF
jgi:hypothetical protein